MRYKFDPDSPGCAYSAALLIIIIFVMLTAVIW